MFLQLIFFAIALSIDSLGIGISYGIRKIFLHPLSIIILSVMSLLFSSLSIFLGNIITNILSEDTTTYISIIMLFSMGFYIVINSIKKQDSSKENLKNKGKQNSLLSFFLKYLGITINTMKKPETCDLNNSLKIEPKEAFYLGTALSIDSMSVGFAIYSLNSYAILFPILVMIFQLAFLSLGMFLGKTLNYKNSNEKFWSAISGFLLISISIIRLLIAH